MSIENVGEALPATAAVEQNDDPDFAAAAADFYLRQVDDAERAVQAALTKVEKQEEHLLAAKEAHAQAVADLEAIREEAS